MTATFSQFLAGFALAAGLQPDQADAQWASFSMQLSDDRRELIESGGYEAGLAEGLTFRTLFPETETDNE